MLGWVGSVVAFVGFFADAMFSAEVALFVGMCLWFGVLDSCFV